jgi:hypothetical protein
MWIDSVSSIYPDGPWSPDEEPGNPVTSQQGQVCMGEETTRQLADIEASWKLGKVLLSTSNAGKWYAKGIFVYQDGEGESIFGYYIPFGVSRDRGLGCLSS